MYIARPESGCEEAAAAGRDPSGLAALSGIPAVDPAVEERIVLGRLTALMKAHPERMARFLVEVEQVIEENRPLSTERTLNSSQAAKLAGCSYVNLLRHLEGGRIGERDAEGRPRFSEAECVAFRSSVRSPGRPKKSDKSPSSTGQSEKADV